MSDYNQEAMDQEDLEFLRELREIPDKVALPSNFHSKVMQTISRREAITSASEEHSRREQPLRVPVQETPLPKVGRRHNWLKIAALIVLIPIGAVFFVSGTMTILSTATDIDMGVFKNNRVTPSEMEKRITILSEQLKTLDKKNQERYDALVAKLEDTQGKLSHLMASREALTNYVMSVSASTPEEKKSTQNQLLMLLLQAMFAPSTQKSHQEEYKLEQSIGQPPEPQK